MSAVAVLTAARARIADPKGWTTDAYARNAEGNAVPPHAAEACSWCAYGALRAEGADDTGSEAALLTRAARSFSNAGVTYTNDFLGHAAVIAMYDHAIEMAVLCKEGR